MSKNEFDRAIADAIEAIRLDPNFAWAYGVRAEAYRRKNEFDRAIADASEGIRLDPHFAWAYGTRALAYLSKNDFDRVIADASEAIRLDPKYIWAYASRASAYVSKGEYERGITDANEAILLDPNHAWAYGARAEAYRRKNEFDLAIANASEAIRLDPNYACAYGTRAEAYRRIDKYDRAIADATDAIRLDPNLGFAFVARGSAFYQIGQFLKAATNLTEAIRLAPAYEWLQILLEAAQRELGAARDVDTLACPKCNSRLAGSQNPTLLSMTCQRCGYSWVCESKNVEPPNESNETQSGWHNKAEAISVEITFLDCWGEKRLQISRKFFNHLTNSFIHLWAQEPYSETSIVRRMAKEQGITFPYSYIVYCDEHKASEPIPNTPEFWDWLVHSQQRVARGVLCDIIKFLHEYKSPTGFVEMPKSQGGARIEFQRAMRDEYIAQKGRAKCVEIEYYGGILHVSRNFFNESANIEIRLSIIQAENQENREGGLPRSAQSGSGNYYVLYQVHGSSEPKQAHSAEWFAWEKKHRNKMFNGSLHESIKFLYNYEIPPGFIEMPP